MKKTANFLKILLLLAIAYTSPLKADTSDTLHVNWMPPQLIHLQSGGKVFLPFFEEAITRYETAGLPWQIHSMKTRGNAQIENPRIIEIEADTLQEAEALADLDFLTDNYQIITSQIDGKNYISVLPLKKAGDLVLRLKKYQLAYDFAELKSPMKDDTPEWKTSSVLANGNWLKIATTQEGVYRLTYEDLQQAGINPDALNPEYFALFGNGNKMLPEENRLERPDDLTENAIQIIGAEDQSFDEGDYLLFYSPGPVYWRYNFFTGKFDHQINYYSDTTFFFFTPEFTQPGKRIVNQEEATGNAAIVITEFHDYAFHEEDHESLILSGKEWYGEMLTANDPSVTFNFEFPHLNQQKAIYLDVELAGRSITEDSYFSISGNGVNLIDSTKVFKLSVDNPMFARDLSSSASFFSNSNQVTIGVDYLASESSSRLWLNYIRINAISKLEWANKPLSFRLAPVDSLPDVVELEITGISDQLIWDVSDPSSVKQQIFRTDAQAAKYKTNTNIEKRWFAFSIDQSLEIDALYPIKNQNLHAIEQAEMLIITHPLFEEQANELAALHQELDQLDTKVIDVTEIYNEFGGGVPDITAIRDFIRMVYTRNNTMLKYVLLFGDASYDYKNRIAGNTNFIPTYQANASLIETQSFVSDDYFGLMGAAEGGYMSGILDLGIGRFPVSNVDDAATMVAKNRYYLQKQQQLSGSWRNNITFVGDDRDNNLHFDQAETLSRQVDTARTTLNVSKIYLDAYPRLTVAGGYRYPQASEALMNQINDGALIINYTGHGGVNGLSDERVFTISHINSLTNLDNMPFFITATCEFSRFDNPDFVSAGEQLLLNPEGGGIGLMTTTRLAFAHSNFALNKKVYASMFDRSDAEFKRLGDILRLSKNPTSSSIYNFVLLGNPALRLVYPEKEIITTKVNELPVSETEIVLHSMSYLSIEGEIIDANGQVDSDFNGYLYPKLFDKRTNFTTLGNASNSRVAPFSYFDKVLLETKVTVKEGRFEFQVSLPKDIAYQYGQAKLSYYAVDTVNFTDATGYFNQLEIGGTDPEITPDTQGPEIILYMNTPAFKQGDIVSPDSELWIFLNDPQGINYLGNSIGRDIVLTSLSPNSEKHILNHFFEPVADNFGKGWIRLPMNDLENGEHILSLKAWDLHNNASEAEIRFFVDRKAELAVNRVINYPNPFSDQTAFVFDHGKPGAEFEYRIDIFNIDGRYIISLEGQTAGNGQRSQPIIWNGVDQNGRRIPPGIYVYKLWLTDEEGIQNSVIQRFVRI